MQNKLHSTLFRYAVPIGAVAASLLAVRYTAALSEASSLFLVLGAVFLGAWYGGLAPGLVATGIATLGVAFTVMEPRDSLGVDSAEDLLRLGLFAGTAAGVSFLTAQSQRTQARLMEVNEQLRELSARMERVREDQRAALAHDIHDEIGGALAVLKIDASFVQQRTFGNTVVQERMTGILKTIDETIEMVQRLATELRPSLLNHAGLAAAMESYLRETCRRAGLQCEEQIDTDVHVERDCALALFRAFQEALTNVLRHAEATKVKVSFRRSAQHLTVSITDNGVGVTEAHMQRAAAFGLLGMKERVRPFEGTVSVRGAAGVGTTVTISVPARYCSG